MPRTRKMRPWRVRYDTGQVKLVYPDKAASQAPAELPVYRIFMVRSKTRKGAFYKAFRKLSIPKGSSEANQVMVAPLPENPQHALTRR